MEHSSRASGDLTAALEELPLFPLPQAVLLPGALLPLHVFEPRYRKMVRDVLDGHRTLSVVNIPDATKLDERGMPIIARVAGVGTIVDHAELPSGRYNILLRGRARVTLEELTFVPPYRRARATILPSRDEDVSSTATASLIASSTAFVALVRERDASFDFRMPKLSDPGTLADHCAQQLLIDARDRQTALETTSVVERVRFVTETLALQKMTLAGMPGALN
ncbi:MAG: LON peptidase substrate-binding domain-containing protein [Polyangiaceae bacterium]|nr:LON peptidase substrate-binding domain-containing protein [Polyangiaceae bacterium]